MAIATMRFKAVSLLLVSLFGVLSITQAAPKVDYSKLDPTPFGDDWSALDSGAVTGWEKRYKNKNEKFERFANKHFFMFNMDVPRDEVIAFALYTCSNNTLKLTTQLFPLKQGEDMEVRLEIEQGEKWVEVAREPIIYPGWSAHFRVNDWKMDQEVRYRIRHGAKASFDGVIRKDPVDKDEIVVANMSCSGYFNPDTKPYERLVENLKIINPDLLFFAGDQTYHHTQHTFGWLVFGLQFRDVMRDRPTIAIPDDHDVGHGNLWGAGGKVAKRRDGQDGGYKHPAAYVNMVQRQQTWNLPDAYDPTPVNQGIGVYYTSLTLGKVDFVILEDRKFKSPPMAVEKRWSGRNDHVRGMVDWDPSTIDKPELTLLGDRQLSFIDKWSRNWNGVDLKVALSQTAFCGAVTHHGNPGNALRADLDSNAWPQAGRNRALRLLRRVRASHLCGDQHLAVAVKHGIDAAADGPYAFTSPALMNTIFGRWWKPEDEQAGADPRRDVDLKWTGNYKDGLDNPFRMLAYANPPFGGSKAERNQGAGFGIARFNKKAGTTSFDCWSLVADVKKDSQFVGWPVRFKTIDNDSRKPVAYLKEMDLGMGSPVVEVIRESDGKTLYVRKLEGPTCRLPVFDAGGKYTVKAGKNGPDRIAGKGLVPVKVK